MLNRVIASLFSLNIPSVPNAISHKLSTVRYSYIHRDAINHTCSRQSIHQDNKPTQMPNPSSGSHSRSPTAHDYTPPPNATSCANWAAYSSHGRASPSSSLISGANNISAGG